MNEAAFFLPLSALPIDDFAGKLISRRLYKTGLQHFI